LNHEKVEVLQGEDIAGQTGHDRTNHQGEDKKISTMADGSAAWWGGFQRRRKTI
jgi:hypothetical protein